MRRDDKGNFIGEGEDSAVIILESLLPSYRIERQVKLYQLLKEFNSLGNWRQCKESVDIVLISKNIPEGIEADPQSMILVRVQGKDHKGNLKGVIDARQLRELKERYKVVDIEYRECPELFQERVNEISIREVIEAFKTAKLDYLIGREQS